MKFATTMLMPALAVLAAAPAVAQELRLQCCSDGNECEVTGEIAKRFEAANAGVKIVIDKVPYMPTAGGIGRAARTSMAASG